MSLTAQCAESDIEGDREMKQQVTLALSLTLAAGLLAGCADTTGGSQPTGAALCQSDVVAELPEQIVHVVVHEAVIGDKLVFDLPQKLFVLHVVGRLDGGEVLVVVAGWHRVHLSFYL